MKTHKDLDAWKNAINLVTDIYITTKDFPNYEQYGLTSQIRRSAVSIASNIAEGAGRHYRKEFIQFLYIAIASLSELETQLIIAHNINFMSKQSLEMYNEKLKIVSVQTHGLIKYLKNKDKSE